MNNPEREKFWRAYMQQHASAVYGMHLGRTEELAAAFIARHGIDPDEAEVVTRFDDATMTWTSTIERKRHGKRTLPRVPEGG